jgi:DMSO/TMAO reductase YedYZ molybdopterin-dependent catalytic subunit
MSIRDLFGRKPDPASLEKLPNGEQRLPPGQTLTTKWPVLSAEATPKFDAQAYRFKVWGEVEQSIELTWAELQELPRTSETADFHCVTTWSRYDNHWEGVAVRDILARVKPKPSVQFVIAHSWTGYTTNMPLSDLDDNDTLVAFTHDGQVIPPDHGGPVRLIVPKLYAWKSAKWLSGLEFVEKDRPGFWEIRGYHNHGDPWKEERFW